MSDDLQRTPLYDAHLQLSARMAPFAGYAMPIQYSGILAEHAATRSAVTVFDTCHMGEFDLHGPNAAGDLDALVSCDVAPLPVGRCRYGFLCNEQGGVKDDLIIYRRADDRFMIVVNAGTREGDFNWMASRLSEDSVLTDASDRTAKLDVQGPASARLLDGLMEGGIGEIPYFSFRDARIRGTDVTLSRTGYTGELGFEIYAPSKAARSLWDLCLGEGALPAGLGARDTLRLEMGMPLYGHELNENRNAAESGFTWAISKATSFVGSDRVVNAADVSHRLAGLRFEGRRTAREGESVVSPSDGRVVGTVTSGSYGPSVAYAVALASLEIGQARVGTELRVKTSRTELACTVVELPFYKGATARAALKEMLKA